MVDTKGYFPFSLGKSGSIPSSIPSSHYKIHVFPPWLIKWGRDLTFGNGYLQNNLFCIQKLWSSYQCMCYVLAINTLCFRHDSPDLHPWWRISSWCWLTPPSWFCPLGVLGPVSKPEIALPPPGPSEVAREGVRWITGSLAASTYLDCQDSSTIG